MPDTQPLTDEQKQSMTDLMRMIYDEDVPVALMAATLDDTPVALVTAIHEDGEVMNMHPLAIVITDDLFERLTPPEDEDGQAPTKVIAPRESQVTHEGGTITVGVDDDA